MTGRLAGRAVRSQRPSNAVQDRGLLGAPTYRPQQTLVQRKTRGPPPECGRAVPAAHGAAQSAPAATIAVPLRRSILSQARPVLMSRQQSRPINRPSRTLVMKINAIDIKPGNVLEYQGKLWIVLKRELVQPGKGGAFAQVEMRDLRGGTKLNDRFRTQETVERVRLDEKEMQFLFMENAQATFMDNDNFEQISIPAEMIGEPADFLRDGMVCTVMLHEGTPLSVELPQSVVMEVVEADPVVRGQTASSSYKPGRLDNGRRVLIPPYIEAGTRIVVNTADGSYMERAKD